MFPHIMVDSNDIARSKAFGRGARRVGCEARDYRRQRTPAVRVVSGALSSSHDFGDPDSPLDKSRLRSMPRGSVRMREPGT